VTIYVPIPQLDASAGAHGFSSDFSDYITEDRGTDSTVLTNPLAVTCSPANDINVIPVLLAQGRRRRDEDQLPLRHKHDMQDEAATEALQHAPGSEDGLEGAEPLPAKEQIGAML